MRLLIYSSSVVVVGGGGVGGGGVPSQVISQSLSSTRNSKLTFLTSSCEEVMLAVERRDSGASYTWSEDVFAAFMEIRVIYK